MEKKKFAGAILAVVTIFMCGVCSYALDMDAIFLELKRLNIEVTGKAKQTEIQLPNELSGPNFGLKKTICEKGGYDLTTCAGKKALFTSFPIKEKWDSKKPLIWGFTYKEPLNVWVVTCEEKIVCVYKAVRKGSGL